MITSGLVNVYSRDVEAALTFYRDVLGLPESFRAPADGVPEHVELTAGGFVVALSSIEAARRVHGIDALPGAPAVSLVFWVDDVDTAYDAVTAAGAPGVSAPHDTGNDNRTAVVHDPDGTLVELVAKRVAERVAERVAATSPLDRFDLDDIASALADQSGPGMGTTWLVDRRTGESVIRTSDDELPDETDEDDDIWEHLVEIEALPPRVWYQDMVDFADGLTDHRAADDLRRALQGKGAFRRFRETMHRRHEHLVAPFLQLRDARGRRRAVEWLREWDLIDDDTLAEGLARFPESAIP